MESFDYPRLTASVFAISIVISLGEMMWLTVVSKKESFVHAYAQPLKNIVFVGVVDFFLPIISTMAFAVLGSKLAPLSLGNSWYVWPIGLLIFEFWYWVQHILGHKVRLLWCIHSPHHAPDTLTSLIGLGRNIIELPYLGFFLGFMTALMGVPLDVIFFISMADGFWGKFLHISPKMVPGSYGPLEYVLQTPKYHRGHHAKNLLYMDTNYTSLTLFWDWLLGTLQPLRSSVQVEYGITREVDSESWRDVHLGEFHTLWIDLKTAPGLKNKVCYLLMPPGWSHTGEHKTVSALRRHYPDTTPTKASPPMDKQSEQSQPYPAKLAYSSNKFIRIIVLLALLYAGLKFIGSTLVPPIYTTSTEKILPASVEESWEVLTDFAAYPQWNPYLPKIVGGFGVGETITLTLINNPSKPPMVVKAEMIKITPLEQFYWQGKLPIPGLFSTRHVFVLERIDDQKTRLHHFEEFRGLVVALMPASVWENIYNDTQGAFARMNQALSDRLEQSAELP